MLDYLFIYFIVFIFHYSLFFILTPFYFVCAFFLECVFFIYQMCLFHNFISENCSATPDFNNRALGEGLNKTKPAKSSSYCLMRYSSSNNHANQLPRGSSDRNSITSGASNNISNMNYNFSSNSSNSAAIQDKIQDSTGFTATLAPSKVRLMN